MAKLIVLMQSDLMGEDANAVPAVMEKRGGRDAVHESCGQTTESDAAEARKEPMTLRSK
jgi:hypothetical protein